MLPTLHKTPPNRTIGGVFVCGGKSLNPGRQGMRPKSRQEGICKHGRRNQDQRHAGILGLYDHLGEYESIDELNHLAHLLSGMDGDALAKLESVMDSGEYTGSVKDLINLTQNLNKTRAVSTEQRERARQMMIAKNKAKRD